MLFQRSQRTNLIFRVVEKIQIMDPLICWLIAMSMPALLANLLCYPKPNSWTCRNLQCLQPMMPVVSEWRAKQLRGLWQLPWLLAGLKSQFEVFCFEFFFQFRKIVDVLFFCFILVPLGMCVIGEEGSNCWFIWASSRIVIYSKWL